MNSTTVSKNSDHSMNSQTGISQKSSIETARSSSSPVARNKNSNQPASLELGDIGEQLLTQLPKQLQDDIQMVFEETGRGIQEVRTFVRENPRETLGLALGIGAFAWSLFGTTPGRRAAKWGVSLAMPVITSWISDRFDRENGQPSGNQETNPELAEPKKEMAMASPPKDSGRAGASLNLPDVAH